MEENKIQVLVQIDNRDLITSINSNIFISDVTDWIKIDEGVGDKYAHAQGNYLSLSLTDGQGNYNYIYKDGTVVALTDDEKATLFPIQEQEPTKEDLMQAEMDRQAVALEELIMMTLGGE